MTQRPATLRCASGAQRESTSRRLNDLQELGIAAGVVQDMQDLFERDPQIQARHSLVPLVHPILGAFGHVRTPIDFSRSRPRLFARPRWANTTGRSLRRFAACRLHASKSCEQLGVFK